jgi:hypothetical protein
MNHNFCEQGQLGDNLAPKPVSNHFAGGIFQPGNFIEAMMVDAVVNGVNRSLDFTVIDQVMLPIRDLAFDNDIDFERMPMHPPTFVTLWKRRQIMSGLESEGFNESNTHEKVSTSKILVVGLSPVQDGQISRSRRFVAAEAQFQSEF